jgi:hypothetical protein
VPWGSPELQFSNRDRCEFSFYPFSVWIRSRFFGHKEEGEDFPQGSDDGVSLAQTLLIMRMMESWLGWHGLRTLAAHWPVVGPTRGKRKRGLVRPVAR